MIGAPKFRAEPFAAQNRKAIPPSGRSPEAIWHVAYDTQTYTDNSTTSLDFFSAVNADKSLSNMEAAGQFPAPQVFNLYTIAADLWTALPVSTDAAQAGNLNDLYLLLFVGRPRWTFTLQNKMYGPYPLSVLHATGGVSGYIQSTTAAGATVQAASNLPHGGWNYNGSITIPSQTSFQFNVTWQAAQNLTANWLLRISLFGILSRAVK
jgi:hypothetical protein